MRVIFLKFGMLFFVFLAFFVVKAQTSDTIRKASFKDIIYKVSYLQGTILKNQVEFPTHGSSQLVECSFLMQTNGAKKWQQLYHYPQFGLSFLYGSFGNLSVIGHTFALYPTWVIESNKDKLLGASFKMGLGGAWFEKPYDRLSHPENILIGSRVTCLATLGAGVVIRPIPQFSITAGGAYIHCSNGHTNIPNGGIDNISWSIGLGFKPNQTKRIATLSETMVRQKIRFNARFGVGIHEMAGSTFPTGAPKSLIYSSSVFLSRRSGERGDAHLGICVAYYNAFYDYIRLGDYFAGNERASSFVISPFIGHEYLIGRFSFVSEMYINVYNPLFQEIYMRGSDAQKNRLKRWFSARIGFSYYLLHNPQRYSHQNLSVGLFIKSNMLQADYVDMTLSYVF